MIPAADPTLAYPPPADDTTLSADAGPPTSPYTPPGYEVVREVGRGGMGAVYEARQLDLNRPVALKLVLGAGPADRLRFLAEAEATAAIDNPHVVRVFGSGEVGTRPYLVMEYLPGGTLAARLRDGRLDPRRAAELVAKVARGVAAAHAAGVVHRDLKPANVLFDEKGEPKVADFGLAKRGGSDLTRTGAVMGTPAYMAPEQAKGETKFVGPQADVWALGVILYECLTGKRPFDAADPWGVVHRVLADAPARPAGVPRDLEVVCLKCLAKDPAERYPTAAELADDLDRHLRGEAVAARRAGALEQLYRWGRRNPTVAGLIAAVFLAVLIGGVTSAVLAVQVSREAENARRADREREQAVIRHRVMAREFVRFLVGNQKLDEEKRRELVLQFLAKYPEYDERFFVEAFTSSDPADTAPDAPLPPPPANLANAPQAGAGGAAAIAPKMVGD
jgi:hypothetical protein